MTIINPANEDAERYLIGAALIDSGVVPEAKLFPDDFAFGRYSMVWKAMLSLSGKGMPTNDALLVKREVEALFPRASFDFTVLSDSMSATPTTVHANHYADIIREMSARRKLLHAGGVASSLATDYSIPIDSALDTTETAVFKIRQMAANSKSMVDAADEWINAFIKKDPNVTPGITWGLRDLDKKTLGLQKNNITLLAARPGVGKTLVALNAMMSAAQLGHGVCFFTLDESTSAQMVKMVSYLTGINNRRIKMKQGITKDEIVRIRDAIQQIKSLPILIDDSRGITSNTLVSRARANASLMRQQFGTEMELVVIDYVQLLHGDDKSENERLTKAMTTLRVMSGHSQLDCAVLGLSQLNRSSMQTGDKKPDLIHLRGSGSLEQESDVVVGLHRESLAGGEKREGLPAGQDILEVAVLKNRHGNAGSYDVEIGVDLTCGRLSTMQSLTIQDLM